MAAIEQTIDTMYPCRFNLSIEEAEFHYKMKDEWDSFLCKQWPHNQEYMDITSLDFDQLMVLYMILIKNATIYFKDQWRQLILEEINNKINVKYNTIF